MPSAFPDIDEAFSDTLETFKTNLEPPTKDEIIRAIISLKNNKAPGIDNISAEMLKADQKLISDKLHELFNKKWTNEVLPVEWLKGLIVKFPKKGDKTECTNWRGVTLLSVPSIYSAKSCV